MKGNTIPYGVIKSYNIRNATIEQKQEIDALLKRAAVNADRHRQQEILNRSWHHKHHEVLPDGIINTPETNGEPL